MFLYILFKNPIPILYTRHFKNCILWLSKSSHAFCCLTFFGGIFLKINYWAFVFLKSLPQAPVFGSIILTWLLLKIGDYLRIVFPISSRDSCEKAFETIHFFNRAILTHLWQNNLLSFSVFRVEKFIATKPDLQIPLA